MTGTTEGPAAVPYRISTSYPFTGYRAGEAERAPRWLAGITYIRNDADAERAYFERHPSVYTVEQVPAVDPEWAEGVAELQARSYHGNVTTPDALLSSGDRNSRARAALVTPEQVAAVVAAIEGA
jgi:hypothetical protein